MAASNKKYIELRQHRDFGQIISTSFEFLLSNFGNFFRTVFAITGITFVLSISLLSLWFYKFFDNLIKVGGNTSRYNSGSNVYTDLFDGMNLYYLIGGSIVLLFSLLFTYLTIYTYVKIYVEKGKLVEITLKEVWTELKKKLGKYLGAGFLFFILLIAENVLVVFSASLGIFIYILMALGSWALFYYMYLYFLIIVNEDEVDLMDAFGRSFYLVKGKWWQTFGLSFIIITLCYILTLLLSALGVFIGASANSLLGYSSSKYVSFFLVVTGSVIGTIYLYMIFCFYIIKNSIIYYSYVESKDSIGLLEKIQILGSEPINTAHNTITTERNKQEFTNDESEEDY